ncbi:MAG: hypothetical protein RMJ44_05975 [Cytophagales bacterium]|nr:hypothetical protein [Bernardetiaceae bacterium]MDW8210616.1 hypothetical protein [Cytophagales bacterium]
MKFRVLYLGFPVFESESHALCVQVATACGYPQFFIQAFRNGMHIGTTGYIAEPIPKFKP